MSAVLGVTGPRSPALIERAEIALGIRFPPVCRSYLADFGAAHAVYGLIDETFNPKFRPDAVGITLDLRRKWGLPPQYIVIHDLGDGEVFCLDTGAVSEGDCAVVAFTPGILLNQQSWDRIAESFGGFLLDEVRRFVTL